MCCWGGLLNSTCVGTTGDASKGTATDPTTFGSVSRVSERPREHCGRMKDQSCGGREGTSVSPPVSWTRGLVCGAPLHPAVRERRVRLYWVCWCHRWGRPRCSLYPASTVRRPRAQSRDGLLFEREGACTCGGHRYGSRGVIKTSFAALPHLPRCRKLEMAHGSRALPLT